jgi:hypothetical protein
MEDGEWKMAPDHTAVVLCFSASLLLCFSASLLLRGECDLSPSRLLFVETKNMLTT